LLDEVAAAQERFAIPFLYVTHNTTEALRLGHHAVVLNNGKVKAAGPPRDIFAVEK
jgi:ABC-type molybdate transport system ATPase subunit